MMSDHHTSIKNLNYKESEDCRVCSRLDAMCPFMPFHTIHHLKEDEGRFSRAESESGRCYRMDISAAELLQQATHALSPPENRKDFIEMSRSPSA